MNKQIISTLFLNTFQKEIRSKTLIFLFILSVLIIVLINVLFNFISTFMPQDGLQSANATIMASHKLKMFYWIISIWGGLLGTFLGVNTLKSDMDYGISSQIVAFPIHPFVYTTTRIIGTWAIVNLYYILTFIMALIIFNFNAEENIFNINIVYSFLVYTFVILVFITLGALLSTMFQKTVSLISALVINLIVASANSHFSGAVGGEVNGVMSGIGKTLHFVFPRIGTLNNFSGRIFYSGDFSFAFGSEITHFLLTYFIMVYLLYFVFKKKDYQV